MNRNVIARNARLVAFLGATSSQLLHYIDVYLEHSVKCVVIHVRVNDLLSDSNKSSMENLGGNLQLMIQKDRVYGVNEVFFIQYYV